MGDGRPSQSRQGDPDAFPSGWPGPMARARRTGTAPGILIRRNEPGDPLCPRNGHAPGRAGRDDLGDGGSQKTDKRGSFPSLPLPCQSLRNASEPDDSTGRYGILVRMRSHRTLPKHAGRRGLPGFISTISGTRPPVGFSRRDLIRWKSERSPATRRFRCWQDTRI